MGTISARPKENSPITDVVRILGDLGRNQLAKRHSSLQAAWCASARHEDPWRKKILQSSMPLGIQCIARFGRCSSMRSPCGAGSLTNNLSSCARLDMVFSLVSF